MAHGPGADVARLRAALATLSPVDIAEAGRSVADMADVPGRPVRVAVATSFTTDNVVAMLRLALLAAGVAPTFHVAAPGRTMLELTDPDSELAASNADVTLCLLDEHDFLPRDWSPVRLAELAGAVRERVDEVVAAASGHAARTGSIVALHTVPLPLVEQRTAISYRGRAALGRLWRDLNNTLLAAGDRHDLLHCLDFELVLSGSGVPLRDDRLHRFAGMSWSADSEWVYAQEAARFCAAVAGASRKCLVLDLDNTLWGGLAAEDGVAGIQLGGGYPGNCYTDLQRRAQALHAQGVLLAVCSRNSSAAVEEVLASHPDMRLRPGDFAATEIGWGAKDEAVHRLAAGLGLRHDALVFADDSPFECGLVAAAAPEVTTVALDGDPADHSGRLLTAAQFDVLELTTTDTQRPARYQARTQRFRYEEAVTSRTGYLHGLRLRVGVRPADELTTVRLIQLSRRTNQFTTAGTYREARTRALADGAGLLLGVTVADRFGDEGVVGGVWISRQEAYWLVENLVVSCRVLGRGVEAYVLQDVVHRAVAAGVDVLRAHHRPTGHNEPAARFLTESGFHPVDAEQVVYELPLSPHPRLAPDWITADA